MIIKTINTQQTQQERLIRVAVISPIPKLFDYSCAYQEPVLIGRCVQVPFGKSIRLGVVIADPVISETSPDKIKAINCVITDLPALPANWLALIEFVSRYYHVAFGEVLALALPQTVRRAEVLRDVAADPLLQLSAIGQQRLADGMREGEPKRLLELLSEGRPLRKSVLREQLKSAATLAQAWQKNCLIEYRSENLIADVRHKKLNEQQEKALAVLSAGLGQYHCYLLHGITGSGKTEVYLQLTAACLTKNLQVLVLVPEIGLVPQLELQLRERFALAEIVSLHSAQSDGRRGSGFVRALTGAADIIIGTRLAVFTPLVRAGAIIVDEEHDASYIQHEGVRYSARDVAIWRARQLGLPIILGSATPSLESWQHSLAGRYQLVSLTQRAIAGLQLPKVDIIDVRQSKLEHGLSVTALTAIEACLEGGYQALVFINRRGYAPVLGCSSCGWVSRCQACAANLVYHKLDRRLRCHHCGHQSVLPAACPDCGNQDLHTLGSGTQRLEEFLRERFASYSTLRIDRDNSSSRQEWQQQLAAIRDGRVQLLVGTQMLAKGHDFPKLNLVVVVGADASLWAADYRAAERLFAQLMQVGGRAGRAEGDARVLIQTEHSQHPLFAAVRSHDYVGFAQTLLDERCRAGFPPFAYHALLSADAQELTTAIDFLQRARTLLTITPGLMVYDPVPMRMSRLQNRERGQLLLEAESRKTLHETIAVWMSGLYRLPSTGDLRWRIDVDPVEV